MHFTQLFVGFCNFLAVAALYGKQPPGIIKHDGKPIGKEEVYDGRTPYKYSKIYRKTHHLPCVVRQLPYISVNPNGLNKVIQLSCT